MSFFLWTASGVMQSNQIPKCYAHRYNAAPPPPHSSAYYHIIPNPVLIRPLPSAAVRPFVRVGQVRRRGGSSPAPKYGSPTTQNELPSRRNCMSRPPVILLPLLLFSPRLPSPPSSSPPPPPPPLLPPSL